METYYVTQEQLDLLKKIKEVRFPLTALLTASANVKKDFEKNDFTQEKAVLRYIGGDKTIEFKVKDTLYWLWRIDKDGEIVYMKFSHGTPDWTTDENYAFTATREEIEKWKTPAWSIKEVS